MSESDAQCALNVDGSLKDAKDIVFYNDPDDTVPLSAPSSAQPASSTSTTPTGLDAFSVLLQTGRKLAPLTAAPLSDDESAGANTDIDTDLGAPGAGQSDEAEDEDAPDEPEDKPEDFQDTTL
ncbi:hypothetical protein F4604DRAFT_1914588 [Suillus subluteus]|nr:hypothetical protein F4604DRAFT_1914588 [Suillus subluteus]